MEGQLGLLHSERTIFMESFGPTVVMLLDATLNKEKKIWTEVLEYYDSLQIKEVCHTRQFWTGDVKGLDQALRAQDAVQYGGINSHDF